MAWQVKGESIFLLFDISSAVNEHEDEICVFGAAQIDFARHHGDDDDGDLGTVIYVPISFSCAPIAKPD